MSGKRAIRVGYLHVGRERSGLRRYGAIIAAEARGHMQACLQACGAR